MDIAVLNDPARPNDFSSRGLSSFQCFPRPWTPHPYLFEIVPSTCRAVRLGGAVAVLPCDKEGAEICPLTT